MRVELGREVVHVNEGALPAFTSMSVPMQISTILCALGCWQLDMRASDGTQAQIKVPSGSSRVLLQQEDIHTWNDAQDRKRLLAQAAARPSTKAWLSVHCLRAHTVGVKFVML